VQTKKQRGYQHVYKCKKTMSSRRVQRAYDASQRLGKPRSKKAVERSYAKNKRLQEELTIVLPSMQQSLSDINLSKDNPPIFYSGTENTDTTMLSDR
jgi:hypothetical protein